MVLSSAIVFDRDRKIAEVCFHMIADGPYCDLRFAIRDHMETSLNFHDLPLDEHVTWHKIRRRLSDANGRLISYSSPDFFRR